MALSPDQIRNVFLPTALRGFDKERTQTFLGHAASALAQALAERDSARRDLTHAKAEAENAEGAISSVLLAAQRAADQILAEARAEAATTLREAKDEARTLQEESERRVETELAVRERSIAALRLEEDALHEKLAAIRKEGHDLLELAQTALDGLESLGAATNNDPGLDLLSELQPSGSELTGDPASPSSAD